MQFFDKSIQSTLHELQVSADMGLSRDQVLARQKQYGANAVHVKGEPLWKIIIEPFLDIFVVVLLVAIAISLAHGAYLDSWIIGAIIVADAIIYYVQRFSTERILRALTKKNEITCAVLRDGKKISIPAVMLVPGDIVYVSEGVKIPADARIVVESSLRVDESQLTGESLPIDKDGEPSKPSAEIYERTNMVYQGSFVVGGSGTIVVTATGNQTEFGHIATLSSGVKQESPVQQKINELVKRIIIIISAISVIAFLLSLYRGMEWSEALRFVIALAVSAVPEGLAIAITIILALGMRRMAAKKALVRSMAAIETIGTVTTIATDKTGTLTKNILTVQETWQPQNHPISLTSLMADVVNTNGQGSTDPLDIALATATQTQHHKNHIVAAYPFDQSVMMSGNVIGDVASNTLVVKGAPEQVIHRSHLSDIEQEAVQVNLNEMTGKGYRVIAIAYRKNVALADSLADIVGETKLTFGGLVAIADELRPEAKRSIAAAIRAGITVRMITGDHFETAYQIGRQLGLVSSRTEVLDSRQLRNLSDDQAEVLIRQSRVFSRVLPEDKFRILNILKKRDVTAMTGDGVNDVPAITGAHVGLVMGSGSQIAKDAGDIILLDDNFKSIITAVAEGRTIYTNIRRILMYLLATNTGEVLVALVALVAGMPVPLVPVQILWVNLATDSLLVIPLGLEPGSSRTMSEKPVSPRNSILSRYMIGNLIVTAVTMMMVTLSAFLMYRSSHNEAYARTISFLMLVVMQWANVLFARSEYDSIVQIIKRPNRAIYGCLFVAILLQIVAMVTPLSTFLHVVPISARDATIAVFFSFAIPLVVSEVYKYIGRKRLDSRTSHA